MTEYIEVKIPFDRSNYDHICNVIYMADADLTIEEDGGFLKLYSDKDGIEIIKKITESLELENVIEKNSATFTVFENKNWNSEWEKTISPVEIYDRIIIYPSWKKEDILASQKDNIKDKILIEIDPKMSFGTGHNETTQLMLEMFCDHLDERDGTMLDVGTGTGLLSIAAVKLGVNSAVAFDIDKDSIDNAEEYAKLNNAEDQIEFHYTTIKNIEKVEFDVVAANIIRSVIIDNLDEMLLRLKKGGKLFLSGVLAEEESLIRKALEDKELQIIEVRNKAEWLGIYALNPA